MSLAERRPDSRGPGGLFLRDPRLALVFANVSLFSDVFGHNYYNQPHQNIPHNKGE